MVANKRSEFCERDCIILSKGASLSSTSFLSLGESEKKAISEAEIRAEKHKNNTEKRRAIIESTETAENRIVENKSKNESESKVKQFN